MLTACIRLAHLCVVRSLWTVSRYDFSVWIVTFLSTAIISVTAGLIIGVGFSILIALIQVQRIDGYNIKQAGNTEIYVNAGKISPADKRTVIFRYTNLTSS
jgi:MFS superfamily sulfate permease-like transporter